MNVKKTKKFKENRPENFHVHDTGLKLKVLDSRLIRTSSILALTCCYSWTITYMAQLYLLVGAHDNWVKRNVIPPVNLSAVAAVIAVGHEWTRLRV